MTAFYTDRWCNNCGGEGKLYTSRYGGNDPDVWPTGACPKCSGTGLRDRYTPSKRRFRGNVRQTPAGKIAGHLAVASQARLTLAGKIQGFDFWKMPYGRPTVVKAWRYHMQEVRQAKVMGAAP